MKSIYQLTFLTILILFLGTSTSAQEGEISEDLVPIKVQTFFYSKYSNVQETIWKKEIIKNKTYYKATFDDKDLKYSITYSETAKIQTVETILSKGYIENSMKETALELFPEAKVAGLKQVTKYENGAKLTTFSYYELVLKQKKTNFSIYFDNQKRYIEKTFDKYANN